MKKSIFHFGYLSLILMFLVSCASIQAKKSEATLFYENFSFDDVWSAALKTINGMGFEVTKEEKEKGLIVAGKRGELLIAGPPFLNIHLREYGERIAVDCRAIMKGTSYRTEPEGKMEIKRYQRTFFYTLNKNLGI